MQNQLVTPEDLLKKLEIDFEAFSVEIDSMYKAIDCAYSAWHLIDWTLVAYEQVNYPTGISAYRQALCTQCPALNVMHDVVTGVKHLTISKPRSDIAQFYIEPRQGYTPRYTDGFINNWLMIDFQDGTSNAMYILVKECVEFWQSYFMSRKG